MSPRLQRRPANARLVNRYVYTIGTDGIITFKVRCNGNHDYCTSFVHEEGFTRCYRSIPPTTAFPPLIEVYNHLRLTRHDVVMQVDHLEGERVYIYNNPLPDNLHSIVRDSLAERSLTPPLVQ